MPRVRTCVKAESGKVRLDEIELPDPGPGEIMVRTELTTICGSDLHLVDRLPAIPSGMPQGHEGVGRVEAVGEGVTRFRVGDRVASSCFVGCGSCALCSVGDVNLCMSYKAPFNVLFGCQGEAYLVRSADRNVALIPQSSDPRNVLLATDVMTTAFAAVRRAEVRPGQSVAVFALGPVGLCAVAAAKHYGAERIFAVDPLSERREVARRLGATDVCSPDGAVDSIRNATSGVGVDVAIEAVGRAETFGSCIRSIRMGGTVSSLGMYFGLKHLELPTSGAFFQHRIITTLCPAGHEHVTAMLALLDNGDIDLSVLFTHSDSLSNIDGAYQRFRNRQAGTLKIAITP